MTLEEEKESFHLDCYNWSIVRFFILNKIIIN